MNGMLWSRFPKIKFCGKMRLTLAVSETVCRFNTAECSVLNIFEDFGADMSLNTLSGLRKADCKRIKMAAQKIL